MEVLHNQLNGKAINFSMNSASSGKQLDGIELVGNHRIYSTQQCIR